MRMDEQSLCTGNQLFHVDVRVDEQEPRGGILTLLRKLRPHWKEEDVQMKASQRTILTLWLRFWTLKSEHTAVLISVLAFSQRI